MNNKRSSNKRNMCNLKHLLQESSRCVKCGTCLVECPVYTETLLEQTSARGKLALIESLAEGDIQFSERLSQILSQCLICNACGASCPNSVNAAEIFLNARKGLSLHRGIPLSKRVIFRLLLNSASFFPQCLKATSLLRGFIFEKVPENSGLRLRFSMSFIDRKRFIPPLPASAFSKSFPTFIAAERERTKVGFFTGCGINYLFPNIGRSTVNLLKRHEVSTIIPPQQVCCGLVSFACGDWEISQKMALKNIAAFERENIDFIVTSCASCGAALKVYYPLIFKQADARTKKRVSDFSSKIIDISEFLVKRTDILKSPPELPHGSLSKRVRLTYHDPCHLRRSLGVKTSPRLLLNALTNYNFVEMENHEQCCGMGGSFNIAHYELSLKILEKKLSALDFTRASVLVTSCTGCILQFMDGIYQKGKDVNVMHITEVLDGEQL